MTRSKQEITLTSQEVIDAVLFHLQDEGWFQRLPGGVAKWLRRTIDQETEYCFDRQEWIREQSGTRRLLWILINCNADPYHLCRFKGEAEAEIMHRHFKSIMETWDLVASVT
jgi:hypothetical protein